MKSNAKRDKKKKNDVNRLYKQIGKANTVCDSKNWEQPLKKNNSNKYT